MVAKKAVSKPAKAAPSNTKLTTAPSQTAALTASAFSPPSFHLSLFASVVLGLDAYRLRIHDTNTGRLKSEHVFEAGVRVNSVSWVALPAQDRKSSKKRRRKEEEEEVKNAVVAVTTNKGTVVLYGAAEGAVEGVLEGSHVGEVVAFIADKEGRGWSAGVDGKLVEWDLAKKTALRTITLPESTIRRIAVAGNNILCASSTIYAIDKEDSESNPPSFTANTTAIHTLIAATDGVKFLSAAETDRFINIFSLKENKQIGALVADSDIQTLSVHKGSNDEILAAVTTEGIIEVFKAPFELAASADSGVVTRKKKTQTKKSEAKIKVVRPSGNQSVSIANVTVENEELVVCWLETGVNLSFEKIRWASPDDGLLSLAGTIELTRAKTLSIGGVNGAAMNGVKDVSNMNVDASHTVVVAGDDLQDVGMEDAPAANVSDSEDSDSGSDAETDSDSKPTAEPTFADRFQALTVSATPRKDLTLQTKSSGALTAPTPGALTSVLTQALKTNDSALLESCLASTNSRAIRDTVRKLPSPMAVTLLERLAERLARKPGRAGSLGEWVRWTLVAHGGYLVGLPDLVKRLSSLHQTLNNRANALPRLLALQGRLDMLQSQLELRSEMRLAGKEPREVEKEAEGALYIEGETNEVYSSDEEPEEVAGEPMMIEDASFIKSPNDGFGADNESDDDERGSDAEDDLLGSDEEESEDEDEDMEDDEELEEDENAFVELEASEDEDEGEKEVEREGSVDYDDVDRMDTDEEVEEVVEVKRKGKGRR
ncbi:NUC189-domain-containing protein [Ascodesmis nigricans]|uniref:NUC189-domain-containing protein n=1 Tax=Ascodesmis nigricans TaxID=341454 RepID=A0A4S2MT68_9PEZI|nr:NUC189-domain-containing protein [Ascodesmis nigricans]